MPVNDCTEVVADEQLASRDFWVEVEHPELGATITYPGAPYKSDQTPWRIRRRAPLIGEHNQEIYAELGLTPAQINELKQVGIA